MADDDTDKSSSSNSKVEPIDSNPNQRLTSVPLNGLNYLSWSRAITLALGGKTKLSFISEKSKVPSPSSPEYESWLSQDQLVMSWLLNSMEPKLADIFNYSESSLHMWKAIKNMYGDLNNAARVFQLKKELAEMQQGSQSFGQHLGSMTTKWNELDQYRPHTVDPAILIKRAEEDKVFQLLASLSSKYEDLRSHLLMAPELPSLTTVCCTIQREEVRKKVMNTDVAVGEPESSTLEARVFASDRPYRGRRPDLKCSHCVKIGRAGIGHTKEKCWILHPELKPKHLSDENKYQRGNQMRLQSTPKANHASSSDEVMDFSTSPINLINEFATFLQQRQGSSSSDNSTAMLGKFAGFLADSNMATPDELPGPSHQEEDW